jgi:hypothetical protein
MLLLHINCLSNVETRECTVLLRAQNNPIDLVLFSDGALGNTIKLPPYPWWYSFFLAWIASVDSFEYTCQVVKLRVGTWKSDESRRKGRTV